MTSTSTTRREDYIDFENKWLNTGATRSDDSHFTQRAIPLAEDSIRTAFHRDYTRIVHCRAFRRLHHKTQVFIAPHNDHLSTRLEHSLHVASVSKTICRALKLNEDLAEAISIGHDLGHAPFGHKGESVLDIEAKKYGLKFSHELHSLRVVDRIESPYPDYLGLNLTFAVRDGIACHYGERFEESLSPDSGKSVESLRTMERGKADPATMEGCIVRWSDKVAYLGRDLEDAITLTIIKEDEVPSIVRDHLGTKNSAIINKLIHELCEYSSVGQSPKLAVSKNMLDALNVLYSFNMKNIYKSSAATAYYKQVDKAMGFLFTHLREILVKCKDDLDELRDSKVTCLRVLAQFLEEDIRDWQTIQKEQLVLDYIAGMTDSYFIRSFSELFLPQSSV